MNGKALTKESLDYIHSSPMALEIVKLLSEQEMYAKEIAEELDSTRANASNFLKNLRRAGLVDRSKRTQAQYYKTSEKGEKFIQLREKKNKIQTQIEELVFTS